MQIINTLSILIGSSLLLCCEKVGENTVLTEIDQSGFAESRNGWMSICYSTLSDKVKSNNIDQGELIDSIVEMVAADATHHRAGSKIDISYSMELLGRLHHKGLLNTSKLEDPLNLNAFFEKHPNERAVDPALHQDSVANRNAYSDFCSWFKKRIVTE